MTDFNQQWIILVLDPTTNEEDLRRMLANKLYKPYKLYIHSETIEVA